MSRQNDAETYSRGFISLGFEPRKKNVYLSVWILFCHLDSYYSVRHLTNSENFVAGQNGAISENSWRLCKFVKYGRVKGFTDKIEKCYDQLEISN